MPKNSTPLINRLFEGKKKFDWQFLLSHLSSVKLKLVNVVCGYLMTSLTRILSYHSDLYSHIYNKYLIIFVSFSTLNIWLTLLVDWLLLGDLFFLRGDLFVLVVDSFILLVDYLFMYHLHKVSFVLKKSCG